MSGSIVGKILACVILVILCFIIGAQATEGALSSAVIIAAVVGVVFMLIVGPRSWMLIFLLPPVISLIPMGAFKRMPPHYYVGCGVFIYWIIMSMMGYVRMKWRSLIFIDILMVLMTALMVAAYIRHPVSINALSTESDLMGGYEYALFAAAAIYYVALSSINVDSRILPKILKISVFITMAVSVVSCIHIIVGMGGGAPVDVADMRVAAFDSHAKKLILAIYTMFPFFTVLFNPVLLGGGLFGMGCLLMGGGRQAVAETGIPLIFASCMKGELKHVFFVGALVYVFLFVFISGGGAAMLPNSVGRILTVVPGLQLSKAAERSAGDTWEWRKELWALAWDSRTGYIKDYMFGDGYGFSRSEYARAARASMRGEEMQETSVQGFARLGLWHNGVINIVHRLGYVGLGVLGVFILILTYYVLRVCISLRGTDLGMVSVFYLAEVFTSLPMMFWGARGADYIFGHIASAAMLKLLYHEAKDRGLIVPVRSRKRYVPMMIEQHGDRLKSRV